MAYALYQFRMLKNIKGQPNDTPMTIKVPASLKTYLEQIGKDQERSASSVTRMLIYRGLRLFEMDKELRDAEVVPLTDFGSLGEDAAPVLARKKK